MKRVEHPNPQFRRDSYECLNGTWGFQMENVDNLYNCDLKGEIEVPFCPESKLSKVEYKDFIKHCMYTRMINIKEEDLNYRLVLHFGAVDHLAKIYVNGVYAFEHRGGYTPFEVELNNYVNVGDNRISVEVFDDCLANVCTGKQSREKESHGCFYTRVTGIWQTVWLEKTPKVYLSKLHCFPNLDNDTVDVITWIEGGKSDVEVIVSYEGRELTRSKEFVDYRYKFTIKLPEIHLWELGNGRLYDLTIKVGDDVVYSYFGFRSVAFDGYKFMLNGKSVFQNLVLDQGYYENGIYTAETEEELVRDILLGMELGFNGARLHQKLFEPRFLYHCDRLGYMVWGEYPSWGIDSELISGLGKFIEEWTEAIERDINHPSIVIWCPLNEMWGCLKDKTRTREMRFVEAVYYTTKVLDSSRPCVDTSGGHHGKYTDIFDIHTYMGLDVFAQEMNQIENNLPFTMSQLYAPMVAQEDIAYDGQAPIHISEYGGFTYDPSGNGWGYTSVKTEEEYVSRYEKHIDMMKESKKICGYCYTQLYDVEQEQNGILFYNRKQKFSNSGLNRIANANKKIAKIEGED